MRNQAVILSVLFVLILSDIFSQNIRFRCVQVNDSTDVILYWERTNIPDTYQIEVYSSLSLAGPYVLLASINESNIDSFLHENAQAHLQQHFYYLKACPKNGDPSLPVYYSDTLENLSLVLENQGKGVANLYFKQPMKFATSDSIKLDRKTDGVWEILQTLHSTTYIDTVYDTITFCGKLTYYRIRYDKGGGCENISYAASDFFSDEICPDLSRLDTVSLNQVTQQTELGWERSASADAYGYIVYIFKDSIWKTIDTLYGAENTYYIDDNNSAENESQAYRIATIDTCLNASPLGDIHNTLFLTASFDKCDSLVFLRWNNYQNMPEGVDSFRIYASADKGAFKLIATVAANELKYDYKHVNTAYDYQFFVQAVNKKLGFTSSSNKVDVAFNRNIGKGDVLMRYVSVVDNAYLEIAAHVEDTVYFKNIFLYKSLNRESGFSKIDQQAKLNGTEKYVFNDKNVDVQSFSYFYYLVLTDECDIIYVISDTVNSILLKEESGDITSNTMIWTEYQDFYTSVDAYSIYRKTYANEDFILLSVESPNVFSYSDVVWDMAQEGGSFEYKVIATEMPSGLFEDESVSNIITISKEPTIYIPNAFTPEGHNKIFKPVCVYIDEATYEFKIYNRWGEMVFYTTDLREGWNGTYKDKPAQAAVYAYMISYQHKEETIVKRGNVVLLR